jgi:hypothetical protein
MDSNDDLKKLLLHGVARMDIAEGQEIRPMSHKEEKTILAKFCNDCEDEINLSIIKEREEPGKSFSRLSFTKFLHMIRLFVGGRVLNNFDKNNKSPEVVVVNIKIEYMTKEEYKRRSQ